MTLTITRELSGAVAPTAAPRGPAVVLRVQRGDVVDDVILDVSLTVGRLGSADVVVDHPTVSRVHALLTRTDEGVVVQDCGSHNGTEIVRGGARHRLSGNERTAIETGDVVDIGVATLQVLPRGAARLRAAAAPSSSAGARFEAALATAARTRLPVVLLGPSGSGKTHAAKKLHESAGVDGAFVLINCARLPTEPLALQSDLLGHKKGAFTGAVSDHVGRVAWADGGTLFLDEVESMPALAQGFLLDLLDGTGAAVPLGGGPKDALTPRARLVAATKVPLGSSGLRRDLCERLAEGHLLELPRLEDRREDIPELIAGFVDEQARLLGRSVRFDDDAIAALIAAPWPGQIRQLRAAVVTLAQTAAAAGLSVVDAAACAAQARARALVFGDPTSSTTSSSATSAPTLSSATVGETARLLKREQVLQALEAANGNHAAAARALGVARNTLLKRIKQFDIPADHGSLKKL